MNYVHMFQWNIPADNHYCGYTNRYINVISEWDGTATYNDGRPLISVTPVTHHFADLIAVKDWYKAKCDIESIAQKHFADIAKQERVNKARELLIDEGENILLPASVDNPVFDRYEPVS